MAFNTPSEREVDDMRAKCVSGPESAAPILLAACAFGYAASGAPVEKANSCVNNLRTLYPKSPASDLIAPGLLEFPCSECLGLRAVCPRCKGQGNLVMMVGSAPTKCLACAGSGLSKNECKACSGTGIERISKEACARLYFAITRDFKDNPKLITLKDYVQLLSSSLCLARTRMQHAKEIHYSVLKRVPGGVLVREINSSSETSTCYIQNEFLSSSGGPFTCVVYPDGEYCYTTLFGEESSVTRFITSPWQGLLDPIVQDTNPTTDSLSGVPRDVYTRISSKAASDWPDDYTMQHFVIRDQIKSYLALKNLR